MVLVKVEILNVGDKTAQDKYAEAATQVITGVFTWTALTNNPSYTYRVITLSRVLNKRTDLISRVQAVHYLNKHFPLVFENTSTSDDKTGGMHKSHRSGYNTDTCVTSTSGLMFCIGNFVFLRNNAKYLRSTYVILNCGCLFQYAMTGFMWSYSAASRPGIALVALLPPTILCNVIGEYRINALSKKVKDQRILISHNIPVLEE
ncbi:unnamed protein product [Phytophthora fragariaefolia]|uniref:Unnamed protein product n=1 Tax=Phytophthora fragariaefolia TaxID=1490495 RepID=A0A9W7D3A5_9STRA|nr:unnamed protein product [Phytophthora fragariaefolia]